MPVTKILFEPWSLGDAVIAAACARELDSAWGLVCDQRWVSLLTEAEPSLKSRIWGVSLPYTRRDRSGRFEQGDSGALPAELRRSVMRIVSARGDVRDFAFARKTFSNAKKSFTGWWAFLAWHYRVFDLPHSTGIIPVKNRYQMWFEAVGGAEGREAHGRHLKRMAKSSAGVSASVSSESESAKPIAIHMGAQWKSKQYPHVKTLKNELEAKRHTVTLIASPGDPLPDDVQEIDVTRLRDGPLVQALKLCKLVIVNESGILHVARFLGVPTLAIPLTANVRYWAPEGTAFVETQGMPRGYAPSRDYLSDQTSTRWPSPEQVMMSLSI